MEYEIKLMQTGDTAFLQQIVELQNIVYAERGGGFSVNILNHWYFENPMGNVISFNAICEEQVVAHYACVPVRMRIDNRVVDGLLDMATVTHPYHRGKGLFKTLAKTTYEYAKNIGYEYVVGVANDNSFPGYMKYFPFNYLGKLDVKWGWGKISIPSSKNIGYWDEESLNWRLDSTLYSKSLGCAFGLYGNAPFVKTLLGVIPDDLFDKIKVSRKNKWYRPLNLYVGVGADLSKGHYFNFPKIIKHSPFNLIFLDLTDGKLPFISRENIVFQLIDFDVA